MLDDLDTTLLVAVAAEGRDVVHRVEAMCIKSAGELSGMGDTVSEAKNRLAVSC
jgi:hypothetical protein